MKRILVVDDDRDLLVAMKSFFIRNGYEVAVTISCDEGLQILESFKPGLIFLDINVGNKDGREMCRKIRALADYQHIPVILMSANHEALKLYGDYGANASVEKPFELSLLSNAVGAWL